MLFRLKLDIDPLVKDILDQIPQDRLIHGRVLDMSMGGGQFVREVERIKREAGLTSRQIRDTMMGIATDEMDLSYVKRRNNLVGTYMVGNALKMDWSKMKKFDVVLGNPPFNTADKNKGLAGTTGGDQILFRRFIDKAFELRKDDGIVAYIIARSGINYTYDKYNVSAYNVDTSNHWDYAAGYFISIGNNNQAKNIASNPIVRKVHTLDRTKAHNISSGYAAYEAQGKYSDKELPGSTYGIIETPTKGADMKMGYVIGTVVPEGPKLFYKQLETRNSYTATEMPHYVGCTHTIFYDTLAEAAAALKFIMFNPIIPYMQKRLNEKTNGHVFRALKKFDLSQIVTGREYPVEWGLTDKEIAHVEAEV